MAGSWLSPLALCRASMLGDQAVNLVGQAPGLTARNQPHGEVTAVDQSPDRTRGDVQTPRDPGLRNPRASSLELQKPPRGTVMYELVYAMFRRIVPKTKSYSLSPVGDMVPPTRSVFQKCS